MVVEVQDDDVDQLVALIKTVDGIRSVSDQAADLNAPAVWVQTLGYTFDRFQGYTLNAQLVLVVDDQNPRRARKALQKLLNKVLTKVSPAGPVRARTVLLPEHQPALLPGLAFPLNVRVTATEEP